MKIFIISTLFLFWKTNSQTLPDPCTENKPFRMSDQSCDSFNEICVIKDNVQCNLLLNACKQCPPSDVTMALLRKILEMSKFQSNLTQQTTNKNSSTDILNESSQKLSIACVILQVIIIVILAIHFLETKFNFFSIRCQTCIKKDRQQYSNIKMKKRKYQNENLDKKFDSKFQEMIENLDKKFDSKFQEMMGKMDRLQTTSEDLKFASIQFQFDGIDQEPIELYVHNNYNIVQVKQQICAKLPHVKHDDYKIMKLKYNGIILNDDNQYLLENIDESNTIVNCFIDSSMNASDIVVVKLQGQMRFPDIIQINKNQTVDQLKELIEKIINSKDFSLFKDFLDDKKQMKKTLLNLELDGLENELIDGDCIRIVQTEEGKLIIKSIFDETFSIPAAYGNTNKVSSLMESVKNDYNWDSNNFVLFCNNEYLEEDKYICEYGICADSPVKICNIAKIEGINIEKEPFEKDTNWDLFCAIKPPNNTKLLLKKYKNITIKNWKSQDWMINELKTFLVTENHERFIQLFGVYFDETLYVAMENMEKGTLKNYLKKNKNIERKLIFKWSLQILEGLEYLHSRKVVHRDLNPSNILVNKEIDLKLSSFNLSKYEKIYGPASFLNKDQILEVLKVRYMAPELLNGTDYTFQCDIWSFGTILVRIVSGRKPLPTSSKAAVKSYIIQHGTFDYQLSDKYKSDTKLKSLIDSCLKRNPDERSVIEDLTKIINVISD